MIVFYSLKASDTEIIQECAEFKAMSYDYDFGCAIITLNGDYDDIWLPMNYLEYQKMYINIKTAIFRNNISAFEIHGICLGYDLDWDNDEDKEYLKSLLQNLKTPKYELEF